MITDSIINAIGNYTKKNIELQEFIKNDIMDEN